MFIAKELRKKSIAEYLLYMWQMEDIIRAMGCSLPLIRKAYISKFSGYTNEQKEAELDWFGNLIRMMNEEGKREQGHLNVNTIIIKDMLDLHNRLLQSNKFPIYNAEYQGNKEVSEIEICLDALYGIMMLRMQQKDVSPDTEHAIKEISTFIGLLNDYYIKDETEGLNFGDE